MRIDDGKTTFDSFRRNLRGQRFVFAFIRVHSRLYRIVPARRRALPIINTLLTLGMLQTPGGKARIKLKSPGQMLTN